jgi:hypothetical protein
MLFMLSFDMSTLKYLLTKLKNNFVTPDELSSKVDKVEDKDLSTNNFSNDDVANINNSFDDAKIEEKDGQVTLTFYATSVDGTKTEVKSIDLNI